MLLSVRLTFQCYLKPTIICLLSIRYVFSYYLMNWVLAYYHMTDLVVRRSAYWRSRRSTNQLIYSKLRLSFSFLRRNSLARIQNTKTYAFLQVCGPFAILTQAQNFAILLWLCRVLFFGVLVCVNTECSESVTPFKRIVKGRLTLL